MYQLFFRLILRRLPPERAHAVARAALRSVMRMRLAQALIRRVMGETPGCLQVQAFGLTFPTPLGVAAGLDKSASWFEGLGALGFGFVEVGTVTPLAQEGNPPPRLVRLLRDRALLNRMGFPNPGAEAIARELSARARGPVVGVNVGKSMSVPLDEAGADYRAVVRRLGPLADYLALNVSSPSTPGLRELQNPSQLRALVADVREELAAIGCARPLLLKVSPDLDDGQLTALAELALELGVEGIIAVNTTTDRAGLRDPSAAAIEGGGVSGAPLRAKALNALRCLRLAAGDRLVLISVGGVASADDAWERILAGATLVQAYTAFVYEGPAWPAHVNRELARKVRAVGATSVGELVGAGTGAAYTPAEPRQLR
jgi:dihydroorotate dehydrogenase